MSINEQRQILLIQLDLSLPFKQTLIILKFTQPVSFLSTWNFLNENYVQLVGLKSKLFSTLSSNHRRRCHDILSILPSISGGQLCEILVTFLTIHFCCYFC